MPKLLFVLARGGPALEYALPRVADVADLHVVPLGPVDTAGLAETAGRPVTVADPVPDLRGPAIVEHLVDQGLTHRVDGILTFSEFALLATAEAAVRLGLPGPGPAVTAARDKLVMRRVWAGAGVPVPGFRAVAGPDDVACAWDELGGPLLLKATCGAGSVGQVLVRSRDDAGPAWTRSRAAIEASFRSGMAETLFGAEGVGSLVETIIPATTRSWYDTPGYGDYLSVEGMVVDGTYHPVCVTGRLPTITPFTELSNQAPCVLPEPLQRRVESAACRAVDALGLGTCGTHTELKLLDGQEVCLLETAARLPGAMVTREVEVAHGVDLITQLTRAVLGEPVELPGRMVVESPGRPAAASVALLATDSAGRPWRTRPTFRPDRVDWSQLLSEGSTAEVVAGQSIAPGSPMPRYDPASGVLNFAGLLFLTAPSPATLLDDTYAVLDGLEGALNSVPN